MKQVLIYSIQPEHVLNFLKGYKTDEIRKRDLPQWAKDKLERGEVVEGYGYCTMGYPLLNHINDKYELMDRKKHKIFHDIGMYEFYSGDIHLNGKVVVKFEVSGVSRFDYDERINHYTYGNMQVDNMTEFLINVYITENDIWNYGSNSVFKPLYAHHFTNITPIEPMELSNFYSFGSQDHHDFITTSTMIQEDERKYYIKSYELRKAPQSFQSAWVKGE